MDLPAPAEDALAQPTRARLFALLSERRRRLSTEELAAELGLHVNGVRRQLERLSEVGLVERTRVRRRRGRPRDEWAVAPGAEPGGERPHAYRDIATWLARAIPGAPARLRQVEHAGREIGRGLVPEDVERSADGFRQMLTALGFQPRLEPPSAGKTRCRLCNCPYRDSVRENAEVVCTLHRGLTSGLLDRFAPEARLTAFEPRDPETAGCLIEVAGADWEGDGSDI